MIRLSLVLFVLLSGELAFAQEWIRITKPLPSVSADLKAGQEYPVRRSIGEGADRVYSIAVRGQVLVVRAADVEVVEQAVVDAVGALANEVERLKGEQRAVVERLEFERKKAATEIGRLRAERDALFAEIIRLSKVKEALNAEVEQKGGPGTWVATASPEEMQQFALMGRLKQMGIRQYFEMRKEMTLERFQALPAEAKAEIWSYGPLRRAYAPLARATAQMVIGEFVQEVDYAGSLAKEVIAFLNGPDGAAAGVVSAARDAKRAELLVIKVGPAWAQSPAHRQIEGLIRVMWLPLGDGFAVEFREGSR